MMLQHAVRTIPGNTRVVTHFRKLSSLQEGKKSLHSLAKQLKLAETVVQSHPVASNLHITGVDETFAPYLQQKGVSDLPSHCGSVPDLLQPGDKDKVCTSFL